MSEIIYKPFNCRLCGQAIEPPPMVEISTAIGKISSIDIVAVVYKCPNPKCEGTVISGVNDKSSCKSGEK